MDIPSALVLYNHWLDEDMPKKNQCVMPNPYFKSTTTISGEFPVLIGGPQVPTPLVV